MDVLVLWVLFFIAVFLLFVFLCLAGMIDASAAAVPPLFVGVIPPLLAVFDSAFRMLT